MGQIKELLEQRGCSCVLGGYIDFSCMPRPWKSSIDLENIWKSPWSFALTEGKNPDSRFSILL